MCGLLAWTTVWSTPLESALPLQRTVYAPQQGAPTPLNNLVQGRDGLLWLGTESGLVSFDGVQFRRFVARRGPQLPNDAIYGMAVDGGGGISGWAFATAVSTGSATAW
ncbi:MAG: hypothetical protein DI603_04375 [Roseateles depolymerans]|uniref:Histidine kinase n=1 Tax=Roseateles depolymerans TaxID=76731 RepID=A0A2W5DTC2_9BURK|nr:MAG: hypothetical protein DI603_04375 [Roseateles depolymerans]